MNLINQLQTCLANVFLLYFKLHSFHWNVIGDDFSQYHKFFGDLYQEIWGSVDDIAEHLRTLGVLAPKNVLSFIGTAEIKENDSDLNIEQMLVASLTDNMLVINCLNEAYTLAEEAKNNGLCNFLQQRIDIHQKYSWMIKSSLGVIM